MRHLHPRGNGITFSSLEAADRLELKSVNLPTTPQNLFMLLQQVFSRREEEFKLELPYKDFVKSHGRITFDPKKE